MLLTEGLWIAGLRAFMQCSLQMTPEASTCQLQGESGTLKGVVAVRIFLRMSALCSCFLQRAFAISFCTSSLRTEMEAKHCLEKILGPNENGPVKYAGQSDW